MGNSFSQLIFSCFKIIIFINKSSYYDIGGLSTAKPAPVTSNPPNGSSPQGIGKIYHQHFLCFDSYSFLHQITAK